MCNTSNDENLPAKTNHQLIASTLLIVGHQSLHITSLCYIATHPKFCSNFAHPSQDI